MLERDGIRRFAVTKPIRFGSVDVISQISQMVHMCFSEALKFEPYFTAYKRFSKKSSVIMSAYGDVFEPETIKNILGALEENREARVKFQNGWKANVKKRLEGWLKTDNKETPLFQLQWEAEVLTYVDYLYSKVMVNGNASARTKDIPRIIGKNIPLLGPRFSPPTFTHYMRRDVTPAIKPEIAYIAPINVIHPVYYPMLAVCPRCDSQVILWDGWNANGARRVYGVRSNERAIGWQLRCKDCKEKGHPDGYCFTMTNPVFWDKWPHWKIPRGVPIFFKRAAVTHELFDLVTELRLSSTSAGLAEHLKQLHLLEYKQRMLDYLSCFGSARQHGFQRNNLQIFSPPTDEKGYNDSFITNDMITEIYMDFVAKVRKSESVEYCKTRSAKSISLDNTFKSAGKAALIDKDGNRQNPMKGGILSAINEEGEGLSWRYCMSASPAEIRELLQDVGKRHDVMKIPRPTSIIVDNCCQVRKFLCDGLGKDVVVNLDVYHFMIRYSTGIFGGTKNKNRRHILQDIRDAIIKVPAKRNTPSTYWTKKEQEIKLTAAYDKWLRDGAWSDAAPRIHADQLRHVRKGCLERPREDISMDGSRIEGSHKGWNSIQRAQPSGIEVYTGLAHDFVLRRNIRIGSSRIEANRPINFHQFVASTYTSHHIRLVNYTADLFNSLYQKEPPISRTNLQIYPILPQIQVNEAIGLVESEHSVTFGGLMEVKDEADDIQSRMLEDIDAQVAEMDHEHLIRSLGVDEHLFSTRMNQKSSHIQSSVVVSEQPCTVLNSPQKRKERTPDAVGNDSAQMSGSFADDIVPDPKRRRFSGPPSPGTTALGLSIGTPQDSESETPEPQNPASEKHTTLIDCAPTDFVVDTDVSLPTISSSADEDPAHTPHAFYRFQTTPDRSFPKPGIPVFPAASASGSHSTSTALPLPPKPSLDMLRRPLQIPSTLHGKGLTRSQLLFSIGTSVDPRALRISGDDEFYLFMDMRAEHQWISFSMTSPKWAIAAKAYNDRLEKLGKEKCLDIMKKNPRALMDKLSEIEPKISDRILKNDYISKKSGTDTFWAKHCAAVPALIKTESNTAEDGLLKTRKTAVCTRCKVIKYTGNKNLNHRRDFCADGVVSKPKPGLDSLPEWPQPSGIFKGGKSFDPTAFLITVQNLYEKMVEHSRNRPNVAIEHTLEDEAFSRMLAARTLCRDGHTYFRLYNLDCIGVLSESMVTEFEGHRYLRIDCL